MSVQTDFDRLNEYFSQKLEKWAFLQLVKYGSVKSPTDEEILEILGVTPSQSSGEPACPSST